MSEQRHQSLPSTRPLGYVSAGCGASALLLALSVLLVLWACPVAVVGAVVGVAGRTADDARALSTVGMTLSVAAMVVATVILAVVFVWP